jgi:hypothetical protein
MAHDIEPVRSAVARPVAPAGPEWSPEPQLITPNQHLQVWEWASQVRPPALAGTVQEKWSQIVSPIRAVLLGGLWLTWHWARFAAASVVVALVIILIIVK